MSKHLHKSPFPRNAARKILHLVNYERKKAGIPKLIMSRTLNKAASIRAREGSKKYSHTRPSGMDCFTVLGRVGIQSGTNGENIAKGQVTPRAVMNDWMHSPGHRANILNGSFKTLGVGVYRSFEDLYWTQLFTATLPRSKHFARRSMKRQIAWLIIFLVVLTIFASLLLGHSL